MKTTIVVLTLWFSVIGYVQSEPLKFSSPETKVSILELYTSEGCSSCPPAESWLNSLKQDERLWKEFIPVAFHVDYWNYIGWPDRFSSQAYSSRQQSHAIQKNISAVYTPGFILAGKEWRGWRYNQPIKLDQSKTVGRLNVTVDQEQLTTEFSTSETDNEVYLNVAILGFNLTTTVKSGENQGKELQHDFVVLGYERVAMKTADQGYALSSMLPKAKETSEPTGLAVWVDYGDNFTPIQATGGWLEAS